MANITKEFLEEALQAEILSFEINSGSNPGDGYSSILYTVDVQLKESEESIRKFNNRSTLHLLIKCYPTNQARQDLLSQANVFLTELRAYDTLIPELVRFQKEIGIGDVLYKPPFPEFFYGRAVDYSALSDKDSKKCTDLLENCIIMTDLRKDGGFALADRRKSLDLNYLKLVIAAQAKYHALSWACKMSSGAKTLVSKFPFVASTMYEDICDNMMQAMATQNHKLFKNIIVESTTLEEETKQGFLESLDRFMEIKQDVLDLYFNRKSSEDSTVNKDNILRVAQPHDQNEEPWLVWTLGDSWLNNMLFRYDDVSGQPLEVIFVDLQAIGERDPFTDVAYFLYTSTSAETLQIHLDDLLKIYTETFLQICEDFKVPPIPNFNLQEVRRRFHRAKLYGFAVDMMFLPLILVEKEDIVDMDDVQGDGSDAVLDEMVKVANSVKKSSTVNQRVLGLIAQLHADGVI